MMDKMDNNRRAGSCVDWSNHGKSPDCNSHTHLRVTEILKKTPALLTPEMPSLQAILTVLLTYTSRPAIDLIDDQRKLCIQCRLRKSESGNVMD
jgi:hypothetical protein